MEKTRAVRSAAVAAAALLALVLGAALDRFSPAPSAAVALGTEEAFAAARDLQPREIPPGGRPQRWTGRRARFRFADVPAGAATLEVAARGHRQPVTVVADGAVLGQMAPGGPRLSFPLELRRRGGHTVELHVEPFVAGDGRTLGTMLHEVTLRHARPRAPSARVMVFFAAVALAGAVAALGAGLAGPAAAACGLALSVVLALLLAPHGLLRSAYAGWLAAGLVAAAAVAAGLARLCAARVPGCGPWAFAAALAALLVQGLLASSPVMVVSDAVFHANNLGRVAGGEWLLTSVTQHARPFRFPYGVSFYATLVPLLKLGLDGVALVRMGAAAAAVAGSLALFLALLRRTPAAVAGMAVLLLQALPITLDVHSHGNLSNVFGQALTTGFFAWWVAGAPGGWMAGAALLAVGALAHFSSLVVLVFLCAAALLLERGRVGRTRLLAVAVGLGLAGAYYIQFLPMIAQQVPRLLEGGGQGRGASRGAWDALRLQVLGVVGQWGLPAMALAVLGRPRPRGPELDRGLSAYWLGGAALAVAATVSPLETRYLYALTIPLACAAAAGTVAAAQRGIAARLAVAALLAVQAGLGVANAAEALLTRYR